MKVFVAVYEHRHGTDVTVFATHDAAWALRQEIARDWWSDVFSAAVPAPKDPEIAADRYWEAVNDEYFNVFDRDVIEA